jgi:hypothetical protein
MKRSCKLNYNLIKSRKPTKSNLEKFEVLSLINAKKVEHEVSLEVVDSKKTWNYRSQCINILENKNEMEAHINDQFDHFEHSYNKITYKAKWGSFYGDYKKNP